MSELPQPQSVEFDDSHSILECDSERVRQQSLHSRKEILKNTKGMKKDHESRLPSPPRARSAGGGRVSGGVSGVYSGRYKGIVKTKKGQEMLQHQQQQQQQLTPSRTHDSSTPPEVRHRTTTASAATRPTQPRPSSSHHARVITSAPSTDAMGFRDAPHPPTHNQQRQLSDKRSETISAHSARGTTGVVIREYTEMTGEPGTTAAWGVQHDISGKLAHQLACRVRPSSSSVAVASNVFFDRNVRPPPPRPEKHSNLDDDHSEWNFFTAAPTSSGTPPASVSTSKSVGSIRNKVDTSTFKNFTLQNALDYLEQNPQFPYLHVTSKVFLPSSMCQGQDFRNFTFYDLHVLGVPGTEKSGSLKSSFGKFQDSLLENNQLMQLSRRGILFTDRASQGGDFLSLEEFMHEKDMVVQLRKKVIFRQFFVKKVMLMWKDHVSSKLFRANLDAVSSKSIFTSPLLLQALQRVRNATYSLETSVDLFAFHRPGSMHITEFLQLQKTKIQRISVKLKNMVNNLGLHLQNVFAKLTSFEYVNVRMQELARIYPYSTTMQEMKVKFNTLVKLKAKGGTVADEDWNQLRGVVRYITEQRYSMEKVLRMSQYMVENSLMKIMFNFWIKLSQTVHGLRPIKVEKLDGEDVAIWGNALDSEAKFEARVRKNSASGTAEFLSTDGDRPYRNKFRSSSENLDTISRAVLTYERKPFLDPTGLLSYIDPDLEDERVAISPCVDVSVESKFGAPVSSQKATNDIEDENNGGTIDVSPRGTVKLPQYVAEDKILSSGALTGQGDNFFASKTWQRKGSYLSVDTALVFSSDPSKIVSTSEISSWSLGDVKIRGSPHRLQMITELHMLYNALGQLLDETPNLIKEQFIQPPSTSNKKSKYKILLTDEEVETINSSSDIGGGVAKVNNTRYFNNLKSSAILSSPDLFEIAIRCMHQFRAAYNQSVDNDSALMRLQEIFRKIWTISPEFLCRQLDRSAVLPKIRELIDFDTAESLVDIDAVLERDSSKIGGFKSTVALLKSSKSLYKQYADIKNSLGLITSFKTIISQIDDARNLKTEALFSKLPQTCITRMHNVNLFIQKMKSYFQNEDPRMSNVVFLLLKLKNFDTAKELLESEFDVCNDIYNEVVHHEKDVAEEKILKELRENPELTRETLMPKENGAPVVTVSPINFGDLLDKDAADKAVKKVIKKLPPAIPVTAHTAYQQYAVERDSLFNVVSKCRMFLLYRLRTAGEEIKEEIVALHDEISDLIQMVTACNVTLPTKYDSDGDSDDGHNGAENDKQSVQLAGEVYASLNKCKHRMTQVREVVDSNMKAQRLIVDSHMIVGAAECFLEVKFLDNFADMDDLEKFFALKYRSCSSILDASMTVKKLQHSKLVTIEIAQVYAKYQSIEQNLNFLKEVSSGDSSSSCLSRLFDELTPMLQVVTFFKSKYMKLRHWDLLNKSVMAACNLQLVTSGGVSAENMALNEVEFDPLTQEKFIHSMGTLRSQQVKTLLDRGIVNQVGTLRNIAADSCIEGMIEKTLEAVDHSMKTMKVVISLDWLDDKIFRNKIFFQLHRITNCVQLSVNIQYCLKALTICEHTAYDMAIEIFNDKFHFIRLMLQDMYTLIRHIALIQKKWIAVFHYVKFTTSGEIERETERYFQSCTEEIKKIEVAVQSSTNSTFYSVFQKVNVLGFAIDSVSNNLTYVMRDVHSIVQSMLDGYPRLSILPYHRTKKLIRAWLVNPHEQMGVITRCITDIFPGVGKLSLIKIEDSLLPVVQGICSSDGTEVMTFSNGIRMEVSLDEFLKAFEYELRSVLAMKCDILILDHIEVCREYFLDNKPQEIIDSIGEFFATRLNQILNTPTDQRKHFKPNQCITLVNMAVFAEQLWFCFGYSVGIVDICRPDFSRNGSLFSLKWRLLVTKLIVVCKKNVKVLQVELQESKCDEKTRKLYITLFQLEISFIQCLDEILSCPCLESAIEMWAGRYQIRFLYDKDERWRESPFEVTLGCVGVSYGLEYQGAQVRAPIGHILENALQKVIGSAFVSKGTVFVSQDSDNTPTESIGEYSVSCSDVADALGRIYTTLSSVKSERCVRFFLARLCVLDAVGCVDFANLNHRSIQLLMSGMNQLWSCIDKKDDQFVAEGLRYPIMSPEDSASTSPVQNGRLKSATMSIRKHLAGQGKAYTGIFVVGLASESSSSDASLLDYFSKSAFNTVAVNYSRPVDDLGLLLATRGFKYGFLLQLVLQEVIHLLHRKYNYQESISYLSSSLLINTIVNQCSVMLVRTRGELAIINHIPSDQDVLRIEIECLYNILLEQVILLGQCSHDDLVEIHKDVRHIIQQQLNTVLDKSNRFFLSDSTLLSEVVVSYETKGILNRAMKPLGLLPGGQFMQQCSTVWKSIGSLQSMMIVSGPAGCGKSSLIACAIEALKNEGITKTSEITNLIALEHWRAARTLIRVVKKWLSLRQSKGGKHTIDQSRAMNLKRTRNKEKLPVKTTIIHFASLPTECLIGKFDENGAWMDGMLLRKLRETDDDVEKEINGNIGVNSAQIIILDGPVGSNLEQIFTHSTYLSRGGSVENSDSACKLVFPSGERTHLHASVAVVLETSDLSQASPSLLMHTSHIHCGVAPVFASKRLLTVWLRSICNWLRPYPCWIEPLNFINKILLRTDFIKEILTCDMSVSEMNAITAFSRMSTFIRYFEELLQQCHMLIITSKSGKKTVELDSEEDDYSNGKDSDASSCSDSDAAAEQAAGEVNSDLTFDVSLKEKEKLEIRVQLSLIYASVWGFGGGVNGTDRRVFFDRLMRDATEKYISRDVMKIQGNLLMFELMLDLPQCCFVEALNLTPQIEKAMSNSDSNPRRAYIDPWSLGGGGDANPNQPGDTVVPLQARLVSNGHSKRASVPELVFHTPSSKAVKGAFELLLRSGSNVLFMGHEGTGKSRLIGDCLQDLGSHCPNPNTMKSEIMRKLVDIIGDEAIPDGIPSILELVRKLVYEATYFESQHDDTNDDTTMWQKIRQSVDDLMPEFLSKHDVHKHFDNKTLYTAKTSLCATSDASLVREWLLRELRTECDDILESPRETFAMVFIDDFHLVVPQAKRERAEEDDNDGYTNSHDEDADGDRIIENKVENLVKGLVNQSNSFRIATDIRIPVESSQRKEWVDVKRDGTLYDHRIMPTAPSKAPLLHKSFVSDPSQALKCDQSNFFVNQLGVISACTGDHKQLQYNPCFSQVLSYFSVIAAPQLTSDELHTAFQLGAVEAMLHGFVATQKSDGLFMKSKYIHELVKGTLNVVDSVLSSEIQLNTVEQAMKSYIIPNLQWIGKFCGTFSLATRHLSSTSSLLQLWTHEWKRFTLDPLPNGILKSRLMWSFKKKLNEIDQESWGLDSGWLQSVIDGIEVSTDDVWMNANILVSAAARMEQDHGMSSNDFDDDPNEGGEASIYRPVVLQPSTCNGAKVMDSQTGSGIPFSFNDVLVLPDFVGVSDVRTVLYPEAFSYVLRLVRLLSSVGTNIIMPSHVGSHVVNALKLASCICHMKFFIYDCKDKRDITVQSPSAQTLYGNDFKSFLKHSLLSVGGFQEKVNKDFKSSVYHQQTQNSRHVLYSCIPAVNILMVITSSQLMSDDDRRMLQYTVDLDNPCLIFDNREITGLISAARGDSDIGAEIITKRRKNLKKEMIHAERRRRRIERMESLENDHDNELEAVEEDEEENDEDVDVDEDDISLSTIDSHDDDDDQMYLSTTDPPSSHLQSEMMKNAHQPIAPTTSLDTALPNYSQQTSEAVRSENMVGTTNLTNGIQFERKAADEFQTYVYQLIKSRLVDSVKKRLKTALCLDIPRAKEVFEARGDFQFQFLTKSSKAPTSTKSSSNYKAAESSGGDGLEDTRRLSTRTSIVGGIRRPSRRFSLQSTSPSQLRNVFLSSSKRKNGSVSGSTRGSSGSGNGGFVVTDSTNPTTENVLGAQNILMNCPILSSVLLRRFSCLYWYINRDQSMMGICSAMLGIGQQRILSSRGIDMTPDVSANTFPLSVQLCSVGEGGRTMYDEATSKQSASGASKGDRKLGRDASQVSPSLQSSTNVIQIRTNMKNHLPKVSNLEKIGVWGSFTGETLLTDVSPRKQDRFHNKRLSVTAMRMNYIRQSSRVDTSAGKMFNDDVSRTISSMTNEAETLLSQLLSISLPSDHLLLTQPVLLLDSEKGAEIACTLVRFILESGGQQLLRRKMHLITALVLEDEGVQFLNNLDDNAHKLEQLISVITDAIRDINSAMSSQWALIDSAQEEALDLEDFQSLYEAVAMAKEDHFSSLVEAELMQNRIHDCFEKELDVLRNIKSNSWLTFGQQFHDHDVDETSILVMHALFILTNKTHLHVDTELVGFRELKGRLSDDTIIRQSVTALKSMEFVDLILHFSLDDFSTNQFDCLCEINAMLTEKVDFRMQEERHAKKQAHPVSKESYEGGIGGSVIISIPEGKEVESIVKSDSNHDIKEVLCSTGVASTNVLDIEVENSIFSGESNSMALSAKSNFGVNEDDSIGFDYFEHTTFNLLVNFLHKLEEILKELKVKDMFDRKTALRLKNVAKTTQLLDTALTAHIHELKLVYKDLELQHHAYDVELAKNRAKLKKLAPLQDEKDKYSEALSQNMLYVEDELTHIDTILKCLVADACVAAALVVRTGWLPEQLRQESHDAMKEFIATLNVEHSDSPYVLGCMMDRLQVRLWTQYSKGLLPRDIQSINAMSMLFLSPASTFIIDPEGVAEKAIVGALFRDYECYVVSGGSFSILELEKNLTLFGSRLSDDDYLGFTIVITDVQAGVTDDLVAFLSADIDFVPPTEKASTPKERRRQSHDKDVGVAFNPAYHNEFSPQNVLQLSKVRIVILSTQPPTLDTHGVGSPLPPACFKHMVVLHWITAVQSSFFVDSKQLNTAMNKDHCGSSLLESVFVESMCRKISPSHLTKLSAINSRIIDYYYELSDIESAAFNAVIDWTKFSVDNQEESLRAEHDLYEKSKYLKSAYQVKLGVLDDAQCMNILHDAVVRRVSASKQCLMAQALERDCILYSSALLDVSNMSASFFRMAGTLLPTHALPPHALTAVCIGCKCIQEFINNKCTFRLLTRIPTSLAELRKHMDSFRAFQRLYRERYKTLKLSNPLRGVKSDSEENDEKLSLSSSLLNRRKASIRRLSVSTHKDVSFLINSSITENAQVTAGPVSPAPGRIMRESCYARKISKAPTPSSQRNKSVIKSLRLQEFVSIPVSQRDSLMSDLSVLLQPLHSLFLNASVAYLLENVKPGLEWLVKFCLVMCTWTASVPMPNEEVRLLTILIANQTCSSPTYYQVSHSQSHQPIAVVVVDSESDSTSAEVKCATSACNRLSLNRAPKPGQRVSVLSKHTKMKPNMFTRFTKGIRKDVLVSKRVKALLVKTSERHAALGRPVRTKTISKIAGRGGGMTTFGPSDYKNSKGVLSELEQKLATMTAWNGKGIGPLDGLWISRRSLRYKIDYLTVVQLFRDYAGPRRRWDPVFSDGKDTRAQLVMKKLLFNPTVRMEDDFMAEYLRIVGMKTTNQTGGGGPTTMHGDTEQRATLTDSMVNDTPNLTSSSQTSTTRRTRRVSSVMIAKSFGGDSSTSGSSASKHINGRKSRIGTKYGGSSGGPLFNPHTPPKPTIPTSPTAMTSTARQRAMRDRTIRRQSVDTRVMKKTEKIVVNNLKEGRLSKSSDTEAGQPFGFLNRKQSQSTRAAIDEKKHLSKLLITSTSVQNFKLLAKHSALAPVFKGIEEGIVNYQGEFENWKNFMEGLVSIDFKNLSEDELVKLAAKVVPPQLNPDDLTGGDRDSVGCWALGKELTVLQTLILTSVLVPQAVEGAFEILFTLLSAYINRGNVIVKHKDEYLVENENSDTESENDEAEDWIELSSSDDEDDEMTYSDNGDCLDESRVGIISVASLAGSKHLSASVKKEENIPTNLLKISRDEDDDDDDDDDEEEEDDMVTDLYQSELGDNFSRANSILPSSRTNSVSSANSIDFSHDIGLEDDKDRFQENTFLFNSWTHLKRIVANKENGVRVRLSHKRSTHQLCCRDFENWEEVLVSCLRQPSDTKKFQLITQLRNTFDGRAPLFLSSNDTKKNTATLTNRAREYANHHTVSSAQMNVFNCHFRNLDSDSDMYRVNIPFEARLRAMAGMKTFINDLSTSITSRSDNSSNISSRTTSVEMLDFYSSLGNCILNSSLTAHLTFDLQQIEGNVPSKRFEIDDESVGTSTFEMPPALTPSPMVTTPLRSKKFAFTKPSGLYASILPGYSRGGTNVFMSAEWSLKKEGYSSSSHRYGTGPALTVGMLKFHWLSDYSIPDLIGCAEMSAVSPGSAMMASRDLSFGAIGDEVEGQLHWVMNTLRRVTSTRMIKSVRERIRYSSKVDLRSISCVLVLWKFVLSLESKLRELNQQPAQWSSVLVPLSLWQLARLCLKVSDLIDSAVWQEAAIDYAEICHATAGSKEHLDKFAKMLLKENDFVKAICLMAESFTKISFQTHDDTVDLDPDSDDEFTEESQPSCDNKQQKVPPSESVSVQGRSRLSMLVRMDSRNAKGSSKKGFLSTYKDSHDKKIASERAFVVGERLAENAAKKKLTKVADTKVKTGAGGVLSAVDMPEKPSEKRRRLRDEKRAALIAAANSNYMSFESLSSVNLFTLGPDPRLFIQNEMKNRFFSTLAVFFAGVIFSNAMLKHHSCDEESNRTPRKARTSSSEAFQPVDNTNKSKSDDQFGAVKTNLSDDDSTAVWPRISTKHNDITIGSLMPHEVITTLISWIFEGKDFNSTTKKKKLSGDVIKKLKRGIGLVSSLHLKGKMAGNNSNQSQDDKFRGWQSMNRLKEKYAEEERNKAK